MRVLLISGNRERQPQTVLPLGIAYIGAALRPRHDVAAVDLCFEDDPAAAAVRAIGDFRPDVVGLAMRNLDSNSYTGRDTILGAYERLVAAIRGCTGARLIVGGSGYSLQPRAVGDRLQPDHGVHGEAELVLPWLLDRIEAGDGAPATARAGADGAPGAARLDDLARPARDLYDRRHLMENGGTDGVQTKRGCAFTCTYCDYPDLEGRTVRMRDPEAVADEIVERGADPDVRCVFIVDSVFNIPPRHAEAICAALVRRGSRVPWVCYATPAGLSDRVADAMAAAGCVGVEIGADSGTEEGLRRLRKPFKLKDVAAVHERLAARKIRDCHTYVLGGFGETADDVRRTLEQVDRVDPDVAVFVVFQEQREALGTAVADEREAILELLAREAVSHPGWSVPELGIRTGDEIRIPGRGRVPAGPPWLSLARLRRVAPWLSSETRATVVP